MDLDRHYTDPRLAALYDAENAGRDDHDFYLSLVAELGVGSVLDLGCGTGVLAADCAARGLDVTAVDPAPAMLTIARARRDGAEVRWVDGYAEEIPTGCADLAVMNGHVAQVFLGAESWSSALHHLHRGLRPGGWLAFETRNSDAEPWRRWNRERTFTTGVMPDGEPYQTWLEVDRVADGTVSFTGHTVVLSTGEHLRVPSTLRFRTMTELTADLESTGFTLDRSYGSWDRRPVDARSPELIILARRADVAE